MAESSSAAILPPQVLRALTDKLYDKRKNAAHEIESTVKALAQEGNHERIAAIINLLVHDFALSPQVNHKKGGLIGLAATTVGLGSDAAQHLEVTRGDFIAFFNDVFDALCKMSADPDPNVQSAAHLLDRLVKDIVTVSDQFSIEEFIPLLKERLNVVNAHVQQFLVGWITVLDSVPDIDMLGFLPDFLDGLFSMLGDSSQEIRVQADKALHEFLQEVKHTQSVEYGRMTEILVHRASSSDEFTRLTAMTWVNEFVKLAGAQLAPYYAAILGAVLPCIADKEEKICIIAKETSMEQMDRVMGDGMDDPAIVDVDSGFDIHSVLDVMRRELGSEWEATRLEALAWIACVLHKYPDQVLQHLDDPSSHLFEALMDTLADPSDVVVMMVLDVLAGAASHTHYFHRLLLFLLLRFNSDRSLLERRGSLVVRRLAALLDAERVVRELAAILQTESDCEFAACMVQVLNLILLTAPELCDVRDRLKRISWTTSTAASTNAAGVSTALGGGSRSLSLNQTFNAAAAGSSMAAVGSSHGLLLGDYAGEAAVGGLNVAGAGPMLGGAGDGGYEHVAHGRMLDGGEGIGASGPAVVSAVGAGGSGGGGGNSGRSLFLALYPAWCHSPISAVSLCFLSQAFALASKVIGSIGEADLSVGLMVQLDRLVHLLETPVFSHLRLQLLDPERAPPLLRALYGLLMLLPQHSDSFRQLRTRLKCVPPPSLLQLATPAPAPPLPSYLPPASSLTYLPQGLLPGALSSAGVADVAAAFPGAAPAPAAAAGLGIAPERAQGRGDGPMATAGEDVSQQQQHRQQPQHQQQQQQRAVDLSRPKQSASSASELSSGGPGDHVGPGSAADANPFALSDFSLNQSRFVQQHSAVWHSQADPAAAPTTSASAWLRDPHLAQLGLSDASRLTHQQQQQQQQQFQQQQQQQQQQQVQLLRQFQEVQRRHRDVRSSALRFQRRGSASNSHAIAFASGAAGSVTDGLSRVSSQAGLADRTWPDVPPQGLVHGEDRGTFSHGL